MNIAVLKKFIDQAHKTTHQRMSESHMSQTGADVVATT